MSDFLKKVPEQARTKSIFWSRMENYKKDQDVYLKGEEPGKFYMILTGGCVGVVPRQEGAGARAVFRPGFGDPPTVSKKGKEQLRC